MNLRTYTHTKYRYASHPLAADLEHRKQREVREVAHDHVALRDEAADTVQVEPREELLDLVGFSVCLLQSARGDHPNPSLPLSITSIIPGQTWRVGGQKGGRAEGGRRTVCILLS